MNEKQMLYDHLGRKLVVTVEQKKPELVKAFKKYHGIKKQRRKRISSKMKKQIQTELF